MRLRRHVTQSGVDSLKPLLAVSRDFLHLVWIDTRDGNPQLYYRRTARSGVD